MVHKMKEEIDGHGGNEQQDQDGLGCRDAAFKSHDELNETFSEEVAQPEEQTDARNGIDAVRQKKARKRQTNDAGHDENRCPDGRRKAGEQEDPKAVVVEVLFDLLTSFPGQEA